jgi:metal-responsive CopG/Arc/MetJ family transcriptional regulator
MKLQKLENKVVPVNITMDMKLLQKIDDEAQNAGISRSEAIRQMVQWYLNSIELSKSSK